MTEQTHAHDTHHMTDAQIAWKQRLERDRQRDEAAAAREAEKERIWGEPARRHWQAFKEAHNGRQVSEAEKKARAAQQIAEAPARQQAAREREAFRRRVTELASLADRDVERLAATAHRQGLSDEDVETYVSAHARAAALRSLSGRLATADEKAARAYRQSFTSNPHLARV